ncbi:hypothetical protein NBRC116493_14000 [Aurantivibrio infirmus]
MATTERRGFFRINKELLLEYKTVDAYTADNTDPTEQFADSMPLHLYSEFHNLDKQAEQLRRSIGTEQPKIAEYLSILNKKINLLSRELIAQNTDTAAQDPRKVNLSEVGIAFMADKAIYKDSYLAIRLVFLPSYTGVVVFAKAIRSEPKQGDLFHIAAKFQGLSEADQHILAKYIMEAQLAAKRTAPAKTSTVKTPSVKTGE